MSISFIPPFRPNLTKNKIVNDTEITYSVCYKDKTLDLAFIKPADSEPGHLEIAFSDGDSEKENITYTLSEMQLLAKLCSGPESHFIQLAKIVYEFVNLPELQEELKKSPKA